MLQVICRCLIFLFCIMLSLTVDKTVQAMNDSTDQVWQVGARRWDIAEERRYAEWVESNIDEDFFLRHNIPIDCADVPYAIRWIYARISHLPAAATAPDGKLFGNWSTAWKNLPRDKEWYRDKRFRMALFHLLATTSTETLPSDTYPIRIAPDSVQAGSLFIGYGHAGIVGRIVMDGSTYSPVQTWEATLPRKIKKLRPKNYFAAWANIGVGSGLMRFRWPISSGNNWEYMPKQEQPYYSLEQYGPDFNHSGSFFSEEVAKRIDPTAYDPREKVYLIIKSLYQYLKERVPLVQAGYRHCHQKDCTEGSYLWEVYSTPSRDYMVASKIKYLLQTIKNNKLNEQPLQNIMERMILPISEEQSVTVNYIVQNYRWLSHNPGDPIDARWGLHKCEMIHDQMDDIFVALDFIKKRYSATKEDYYERLRQMNMADLSRLKQEGQNSRCPDLGVRISSINFPRPSPAK